MSEVSSQARSDAAPMIDDTFVPVVSSTVYSVEVDGEFVLLEEDSNWLHHLNRSASLLWKCFDGEVDIGRLARELSEEFDIGFSSALADTLSIVQGLYDAGLLAGATGGTPAGDQLVADRDDFPDTDSAGAP